MKELNLLRRSLLHHRRLTSSHQPLLQSLYSTNAEQSERQDSQINNSSRTPKWFTLPPFTSTVNGSAVGKAISSSSSSPAGNHPTSETTALKWVLRSCPQLPRSLVQKLFRLKQVRRESAQEGEVKPKKVTAKDSMNVGDKILLPGSVNVVASEKKEWHCSEEEVEFIRSIVLYKDPAIIVVNKPPGLPVQGGIGIKRSLDELSATCLRYDSSEPPRLVHRLDRDSSGILVMGRTQSSATFLHSIFREKTFAAPDKDRRRILERKYWALVIGSPRRSSGFISAPLGKVVLDDGKSDRITVMDNPENASSQHAITKYKVLKTSSDGQYTWLELCPLTGRKHQIRVHCAEILGTPLVGDYKYGWQAHKNMKNQHCNDESEPVRSEKNLPLGLDLESGSIHDKTPRLHLHCKTMTMPNVSQALDDVERTGDFDFSQVKSLTFGAPLPPFMQKSWNASSS
ncbi:RNA pseudouridine synthase 4, mitochondrial [Linum grandiflorum]